MTHNNLHNADVNSWLETIWDALSAYREDCIPEGEDRYDREWENICTAMAWVSEELGVSD